MAGEWARVRVADVAQRTATGPFGSAISSKHFCDSGVPVIRGSNLSQETGIRLVDEGLAFVSEEKATEFARSEARPGDLVFTCWGTIDQVGLIDHRARYDRYIVSNKQMLFTPDPSRADSLFLYYTFRSPENRSAILNQGIGSSVPGFNLGQLRSFEIDLPPLPVQKAIAAVLGALDDKIELNRRMNATLEAMARALFQSWFVDFDPVRAKLAGRKPDGLDKATAALFPSRLVHGSGGLAPQTWSVKRWGDIATLEYGKSLRDYRDSGGKYRVYGTNGPIGFHDEPLCGGAGIIIGRKGAYRGVHYSPEPFFVIDTAFYLNPKAPMDLRWAYYELLRLDINGMDSGSAIPSTSRDDFYGMPVVVPPAEIQNTFGAIVGGLIAKIHANNHESGTLAALRDTLLPRLLSGEVAVQPLAQEYP